MAQTLERLLTFDDLKKHLREAVEMIAASAEPSRYRNHLFALFLLKRSSDLFEERCQLIVEEELARGRSEEEARVIAEDPDEHRFFVPAPARWSALLNMEENLGAQLERACAALEQHNRNFLSGVLTPIRFEESGASEQHEAILRKLLAHCDKLPLGDTTLLSRSILGEASAFLLEYFATWSAKKNASCTSPAELMQLLVELLQPEPGMRVCDPVCGSGGALTACAEYVRQRNGNAQNLSLYGQEYDAATWSLCQMNLLLHGLSDARIAQGSTISHPWLDEAGQLLQFDRVIAEPPFSLLEWEHVEAARVALGRFNAGMPPAKRGEFAFVQHVVATLNSRGRAAVIVPHGILFRGGIEKQIRAAMLQPQMDVVETVIGLPEGVLFGVKAPAVILILNRNKPAERKERALFIDAGLAVASPQTFSLHEAARLKLAALYFSFGEKEKLPQHSEQLLRELQRAAEREYHAQLNTPQYRLRQQEIDAAWKIRQEALADLSLETSQWLNRPEQITRATAVASLQEIAEKHDYNLSVARYVTLLGEHRVWDIAQTLDELLELDKQKLEAEAEMARMLKSLGY